ncbi:uncharacterized protein [Rutidosis leptorrhynchoides]|uniref:uncharacterized protein n=1 Tax=Rutidosis leptorrhynchoides TaxID=125765 RepID=UPI003A994B00
MVSDNRQLRLMAETHKLHPAVTVNNIRNFIPIILELKNGKYESWAELFQIHCRAFMVIDHIIPATDASSSSTTTDATQTTQPDPDLWKRLDAIVLQWIYGTISSELLGTVLVPGSAAQEAWERLKNIFHDNRHTRAVYLTHEFTNTRQENFPNMSAYCQELKNLADQLSNVGSKIDDDRLVLQLVTVNQAPPSNATQRNTGQYSRGRGSNRGGYRGRGGYGRGRGGRSYYGPNNQQSGANGSYVSYGTQANYPAHRLNDTWQPNNSWTSTQQWQSPPFPNPTNAWHRPNSSNNQVGLLGPRPLNQGYAQSVSSNTPTDIESAMYTMSLHPPDDNNWYMDTCASSNMTCTQGNLLSYLHSSHPKYILVDNGNRLPIHGFGHSYISSPQKPLVLSNILYAPQLIKNLIYVRRLTTDNNVSISFDPFGFTVFRRGPPSYGVIAPAISIHSTLPCYANYPLHQLLLL